jgi:hypothetical protein
MAREKKGSNFQCVWFPILSLAAGTASIRCSPSVLLRQAVKRATGGLNITKADFRPSSFVGPVAAFRGETFRPKQTYGQPVDIRVTKTRLNFSKFGENQWNRAGLNYKTVEILFTVSKFQKKIKVSKKYVKK